MVMPNMPGCTSRAAENAGNVEGKSADPWERRLGDQEGYTKAGSSGEDGWLAEKKDIAERLLKNTSAKTENVKGFFGGLETKLKGPTSKKSDEGEDKPKEKLKKTVSVQSPEEEKKGEKIYLYMHLKQQPIWEKWCHMTQEERDDSLRFNENITFGQLGTFIHNMLAFGLNKKLCSDFLKKQATIGNLDEGLEGKAESPPEWTELQIGPRTAEDLLHITVTQSTAPVFPMGWEKPEWCGRPSSGSAGRTILSTGERGQIRTRWRPDLLPQRLVVLLLLEVMGNCGCRC
ncbi:hypothetical protein llap_14544 [Limosa lapponica baueri]|uniref:Uncharacterized protein n=1 Tax=Limosa lapponica baueri TaxID=1758121 RepID=A0A2I0TN38_LIMLA|nr:hypothetical protein llap_14544 [Limosa lapponica baueri]